jgi:exopolysaccharide biosynthesis protein
LIFKPLKKATITLLIIFSLLSHPIIFAQNDSLTFMSANWKTKKIAKGIFFKQFSFKNNLFGSNQTISILEIKPNKKKHFAIEYDSKELKTTSEFGRQAKAIAAINGTFFDTKNGISVDFLKVNGLIVANNKMVDSLRSFHQKAAIIIDKGKLYIDKWNNTSNWETTLLADNIMVSGPLLIFEQVFEGLDNTPFSANRHPRSAVVVTKSNRILLIAVDGRNENAAGMSLSELQNILYWLDASDAINLDGGGSTSLWINNKPDGGVVNYPSDNKKWDHYGERKVANVLLVKKR